MVLQSEKQKSMRYSVDRKSIVAHNTRIISFTFTIKLIRFSCLSYIVDIQFFRQFFRDTYIRTTNCVYLYLGFIVSYIKHKLDSLIS